MKLFLLALLGLPFAGMINNNTSDGSVTGKENISPLAVYSPEWNNAKYNACNTAAKATYMTAEERKMICILNMMRMNPKLFARTVVQRYPDINNMGYLRNSDYYKSLLDTLSKLKPMKILYPDSLCFNGAQCHAITAGEAGYVGHTRQNDDCKAKWYFNGECCDYGHSQALDIIMNLMIDEGVESLGHRWICLNGYKKIGVSIQPHKAYGNNAVLDFHY